MILYVILTFVAILIGMAISVMAFGTGGKRKKIFQNIYWNRQNHTRNLSPQTYTSVTKNGRNACILMESLLMPTVRH